MRQVGGNMADSSALAFDVEKRNATLGGGIELEDLGNAKAFFKTVPHFGRQAVAAGHPDPMPVLVRRRRGMQQVAAKFADVLEHRAVPTDYVAPEVAGREFFPDDERTTGDQNRPGRKYSAHAVIHGQAVIQPVCWLGIHHAGKPVAPLHDPGMADVGGLR